MQRLDDMHQAVDMAMDDFIQARSELLARNASVLEAMSPLKTLARGYSVTLDAESGKVIQKAQQVQVGQQLKTKLAKGELLSTVTQVS